MATLFKLQEETSLAKPSKWVERDKVKENVYWPNEEMKSRAWVHDASIYEEASKDPTAFWSRLAKEGLDWVEGWSEVYQAKPPHFKWFLGGKLNASYNCVDRHVNTWRRNKAAIIWVPEPLGEPVRTLTYMDLYREVNRMANTLRKLGVGKGDRVGIYLPMIPEVQVAMLACARIGAVHSVVFSAFSSASLKDRLLDAGAKLLITADGYYRRGKAINLKAQADAALKDTKVEKVILVKRLGLGVELEKSRDYWWHELRDEAEPYCSPEPMDSEDILFILYTSGTTGKPKGIIHETGGYLTQAYWTTRWIFDVHDDDLFWCTSDIGWVTGHTYNCYGPLSLGATMLIYEGAPDYPHYGRVWEIVEEHGVTILYTAPTMIRMLMKVDPDLPRKYDLTSLRLLGSVGEPINLEAWKWFFEVVGGGRCPIVDTWWQTETGGILISSLPGIGPIIPTVAGRSFPGTKHLILDEEGRPAPMGEEGYLVQIPPFAPGMLRGIWGDPKRYVDTYFSQFGPEYYFTGDGARMMEGEAFRIIGRLDDVLKVAGHRLSTAELENAIASHPKVAEAAVVGVPHEVKGEVPVAFVILKAGVEPTPELERELVKKVDEAIGPIARPERVVFVTDVPKTRSGKIMRRILRKLLRNEPLGDVTTLMNPEVVEELKSLVGYRGSRGASP
ncbi:MAG: acetate--CoA ligase [Thermoprotei archaeon]|nr:MAG: acetate--CoA ligase [Thermoprotei archaeon]